MDKNKFDLLKSHIDAYTRKDGSVVAAHDDKRVAAQPQYAVTHNVKSKGSQEGAIHEINAKPADVEKKLNMKPGSLSQTPGGHYSATHQITHANGTSHSVYANSGSVRIRPLGHKNAAATEALKQHLDSEGNSESKPASLSTHVDALRRSSKPGELDHEDNQIAAGYMKSGDHKSLAAHVKNLDTAARDHILDHVHPDHREGLGFKQLNMDRSKKQYAEKFPAKTQSPKAATVDTHADHDDASSKMIQHGQDLEDAGYKRGDSTHADGGVKNGYSVAYSHEDGKTATASMSRSKEAKGAWETKLSHGSPGPADGKAGGAAPPHGDVNEAKWDSLPDEENPKHALSRIGSAALSGAASGKDDLNHRAKQELAARGKDSNGDWVGFDKANAHHGVTKESHQGDPDEMGGHFQTIHTSVLSAAAKGNLDLNRQAKSTLASRGHDSKGSWVGFSEAKKHHGIK